MDLDTSDVQSQAASQAMKLKQVQVAECDEMDVEDEENSSEVLNGNVQQHIKDAPSSVIGSVDSGDQLKGLTSGSIHPKIVSSNSDSDVSYHDEDDGTDFLDYGNAVEDDGSDYDDNDECLYDDGENDYLDIQSQFDSADLPSGVEASLPWLKEPPPSGNGSAASSSNAPSDKTSDSKRKDNFIDDIETERKATNCGPSGENKSEAASVTDLILRKFKDFKQFDTVEDFSDHHYKGTGFLEQTPSMSWAKKIQEEWEILEKDLPDTIFVRVYESRMDLLRAVIVGPSGTPYHDGLFVFDCLFPANYPDAPPMVYYYSGGLRLNPNLYECGKVCLSLLGTWSGKETEKWVKGKSTMLQVLVSIQALILNEKPFFNEPGYETSFTGADGDARSKKYNEEVFILSLKTMMYTTRRPPKHFEDFVIGHFHNCARDLLVACNAYVNGATVACVSVKDGVADVNRCDRKGSPEFRAAVRRMINMLITTFSRFGRIDCEQFRLNE